MNEVHQRDVERLIQFRDDVAVMGNGMSALQHKRGDLIDSHKHVIRINAAIPHRRKHYETIGRKTTILAVAKRYMLDLAYKHLGDDLPKALIYMKPAGLTSIGDRDWLDIKNRVGDRDHLVWRYTMDMELRCHEAAQANLSTGPRIADWLRLYVQPRRISLFGFDFFGVTGGAMHSWYEGKADRPHDGEAELAYIKAMGFKEKEPGWWLWAGRN